MKDYLAIIRKLDFVDLFKYGQFSISYAVPFDGLFYEHAEDDKLFDTLTLRMNMYEYSFEYLIVHFKAKENDAQYMVIDVRDVQGIYTFDAEAKREMSISFDPRIQLHVSPWAGKFEKLQQKLTIKQSTRGVDNLWTIFGLPESDRIKCEKIITTEVVQEVFRELYAYERPSGDLSIWTYLLRYERHSFYPKDMLGYFCDFIHVVCNYSKRTELSGEVAEYTQLYPQLTVCKNPQFVSLYKIVEASPISQMTEQVSGCRFAIAAPLFLFLKAQFVDGMEHKPNEETISYAKEIGGFECSVAVFLLGLTLGYDKTYDAFYESVELSFFKKKIEVDIPNEEKSGLGNAVSRFPQDSKTSNKEVNPVVGKTEKDTTVDILDNKANTVKSGKSENPQKYKQEDLFCGEFNHNEDMPILWMKKKLKGQKADVRPAYSEGEIKKLYSQGYERVYRFTATVNETITLYGLNPELEKKRFAKKK